MNQPLTLKRLVQRYCMALATGAVVLAPFATTLAHADQRNNWRRDNNRSDYRYDNRHDNRDRRDERRDDSRYHRGDRDYHRDYGRDYDDTRYHGRSYGENYYGGGYDTYARYRDLPTRTVCARVDCMLGDRALRVRADDGCSYDVEIYNDSYFDRGTRVTVTGFLDGNRLIATNINRY
jgi:hypothetical protein